jgi:class 3 adenylate cyclase/tetratricopeptide (TPR) repeat protein
MLDPPAAPRRDGGERKQATILFADIVGSTHLISRLDAEDAMGRLQPLVAMMAQSVRRFDGWIMRTLGDGLMAAFGAPLAQEGHALLACKAALAMQEAVLQRDSAPRIRIGLHSGEVVASEFDSGSAVEQQTSGITVHVASRLEQLAEPGTICVSETCIGLVRAYCDTVPLGPQAIRGYEKPLRVHRLLGLKPAVASEQFRGSELTALYGREDELAILQRALADAEKGMASVIAISAPPGLGKSRLCYEFGEWCRRRHVEVLEARGLVFGQATPLQPVLEMLRSFFRISPLDDPAQARQKMLRVLQALDPAFEDDVPPFSDFLGVGDPDDPMANSGPRARQTRLRAIFGRLMRSAGRRTWVIIVEDVHWLDEASTEFIETLVDAVEGTHTVLVLNFRPPYEARWMNRPCCRKLSLRELTSSDMRNLLHDLTGGEPEIEAICAHVAERSGGNPFFAEELVRSLAESGLLAGRRGSYRLGGAKLDAGLPPTLEAVLGARLDRLAEPEKFLLQIGATIGKEFPLSVLERVATVPPKQIKGQLDSLCDAGLIQERTTMAGPGFAFRHPLIQEVAYSMQLRARRRRLHAAVAAAIESFEWGQLDEFASLLAHHCEASDQPLKAAMHLQRAARWIGRTNSAEAIKTWEKIRSLLNNQPHTETADRLRALASGQILSSGWREGMLAEEAKPYAEEALRYARAVGDQMYEPMLLGSYGRILGASGVADDYVALAREALTLTSQANDAGRTVALGGMLSQAYWLAGLLNEALAVNDSTLAVAADQPNLEKQVTLGLSVRQLLGFDVEHWIKCMRTRILVGLGRLHDAEDWAKSLLQLVSGHADPPVTQFIPHLSLVEIAWWQNDPAVAQENATRVNEYAERTAIPYLRVAALGGAGLAKSAAGNFSEAARSLRNAIDFAHHAKAGLEFMPRLMSDLADTQYRAGEMNAAADTALGAIELAHWRTHRFAECYASITRAAALIALGAGGNEAIRLLNQAERLILVSGALVLQPKLTKIKSLIDPHLKSILSLSDKP